MDYSEFFASKIDAKEVSSQWFVHELLNFVNEVKFFREIFPYNIHLSEFGE